MTTTKTPAPDLSKYEADATDIQTRYTADGVVLIVLGGISGNGCCSKVRIGNLPTMAETLRAIANDMDEGFRKATGKEPKATVSTTITKREYLPPDDEQLH